MIDWFSTLPSPRGLTVQSADAGQKGWRLHAVVLESKGTTLGEIRLAKSACGITPEYGWTLDLFIEKRCARCERALAKRDGVHPHPFVRYTDRAGKYIYRTLEGDDATA